jgi:enamine deaminase RidA (YjgF/YER057c/UK114 family)
MRSVNVTGDAAFERFNIDGAREAGGLLMTSGQIGAVHGDLAEQIAASLDAVEALLHEAGYSLDDVIRLGIFTTDLDGFVRQWHVVRDRFAPGTVPPHTLLPVLRLANPRSLVEIEATALRPETGGGRQLDDA